MAKRHGALGGNARRSAPPKTKKRKEIKWAMLAARAAKKAR